MGTTLMKRPLDWRFAENTELAGEAMRAHQCDAGPKPAALAQQGLATRRPQQVNEATPVKNSQKPDFFPCFYSHLRLRICGGGSKLGGQIKARMFRPKAQMHELRVFLALARFSSMLFSLNAELIDA